jgi:hypothetical protein
VRDDDSVERAGVKREVPIGAVRVQPIRVEEAAVEQYSLIADFEQMSAAGHLPSGSMKRDAQPIALLPHFSARTVPPSSQSTSPGRMLQP